MEKEEINNYEENLKNQEELKTEEDTTHKQEKDKSDAKEELVSPEEEILNLKDKLTRTFAEMENQRRRFEKEKDDAFEYGGFAFAREALNVLDNLDRSKISLVKEDP